MSTGTPSNVEMLLEHGAWMRRLAQRLASDAEADDLTQETWRAAIESPPDADRPLRPWLAQVLRNTVRTAFRRTSRRRNRERQAQALDAPAPGIDETVARAELHQRIAQLLTTLEEPYRTTLVARFYEGLEPTEIGQRWGVPPGTIRWRLSEGLRRLRSRLDEAHGGDRRLWCALVPFERPTPPAGQPRGPRGLLSSSTVQAGLPLILAAVLGGGLLARKLVSSPAAPEAAIARAKATGSPGDRPSNTEDAMTRRSVNRAATLVGAALPALVAAAQAQAALSEEAVSWCVDLREKVFACKDEFADAYVARRPPPADRRWALVGQASAEITEEGSGPLEPRREKCRQWVSQRMAQDPGGGDPTARLQAVKKTLAACAAREGCKARVECLMPLLAQDGPPPVATPPEKVWDRLGNRRLIGKVVDAETGAPIARAEVLVLAVTTKRKLVPQRTDAAGSFVLEGLPEGEPVKIVAIGDRKSYVIERRLVDPTAPSPDVGTIRLTRGDLEARYRSGTWRGVTGILASEDESATVAKVGPGTPAERAGVRSGDRILAVDGKEVRGLPFGGLEWRLRGRPGSSVAVTVQTGAAAPRTVTLARVPD